MKYLFVFLFLTGCATTTPCQKYCSSNKKPVATDSNSTCKCYDSIDDFWKQNGGRPKHI